MRAPTFREGQIEQAIFTWGSRNIGGDRGQGFGSVSAPLLQHTDWLESLDVSRFQLLGPNLTVAADGYAGWSKQFSYVGRGREGNVGLLYRKMADGGTDASGRPRHVVHILFGHSTDLDFSSTMTIDDKVWLSAEDCPLDDLPRLESLQLADLIVPFDMSHQCTDFDENAARRREQVPSGAGADKSVWLLTAEASLCSRQILAATPCCTWPFWEFDHFVGPTAPEGRLKFSLPKEIGGRNPSDAPYLSYLPGLQDCALHTYVRQYWAGRSLDSASWGQFVNGPERAGKRQQNLGAAVPSQLPHAGRREDAISSREQASGSRQELDNLIERAQLGLSPDDGREAIFTEAQALRLLELWSAVGGREAADLLTMPTPRIMKVFSKIESSEGYIECRARLLDASASDLYRCWRETSLGVFAYVLLLTSASAHRPIGSSLVPRRLKVRQLRTVCQHLLTATEGGAGLVAVLFRQGLATERGGRAVLASLIRSFPDVMFSAVLPSCDLPDDVLGDILGESFEEWCEWLHLPEAYIEAIRGRVARRRTLRGRRSRPKRSDGAGEATEIAVIK